MEDSFWKKDLSILSRIASFFIKNVPTCIVFSNISKNTSIVVENFGHWKRIFDERWSQLSIYFDDDGSHKNQVVREYRIDITSNKIPRKYLRRNFSRKIQEEIEQLGHKGTKISYRYPLNWFRGKGAIFGFYGSESEKDTRDLGPRLITKTKIVKVFRFMEKRGRYNFLISLSKYEEIPISEVVFSRIFFFTQDDLMRKKKFLKSFVKLVFDFTRISYERMRVFPNTVLRSVNVAESWEHIEKEDDYFRVLPDVVYEEQFSVLIESLSGNTYSYYLLSCFISVSDDDLWFESKIVRRKSGGKIEENFDLYEANVDRKDLERTDIKKEIESESQKGRINGSSSKRKGKEKVSKKRNKRN